MKAINIDMQEYLKKAMDRVLEREHFSSQSLEAFGKITTSIANYEKARVEAQKLLLKEYKQKQLSEKDVTPETRLIRGKK